MADGGDAAGAGNGTRIPRTAKSGVGYDPPQPFEGECFRGTDGNSRRSGGAGAGTSGAFPGGRQAGGACGAWHASYSPGEPGGGNGRFRWCCFAGLRSGAGTGGSCRGEDAFRRRSCAAGRSETGHPRRGPGKTGRWGTGSARFRDFGNSPGNQRSCVACVPGRNPGAARLRGQGGLPEAGGAGGSAFTPSGGEAGQGGDDRRPRRRNGLLRGRACGSGAGFRTGGFAAGRDAAEGLARSSPF